MSAPVMISMPLTKPASSIRWVAQFKEQPGEGSIFASMSGTTASTFKVGLVQMRSGLEPQDNLVALLAAIDEANNGGADHALTPEMTNILALKRDQLFAKIVEEEHPPPHGDHAGKSARTSLGIDIHVGSLAIKVSPEKAANRSFLIDRKGDIASRYDKIYMFYVDLAGRRELLRIQQLPRRRVAVIGDLPVGPARSERDATTCGFRRFIARWPRPAPRSWRSLSALRPGKPARRIARPDARARH